MQREADYQNIRILPDSQVPGYLKKHPSLHAMFVTMNAPDMSEHFFHDSSMSYTNIFLTTPYNHLAEVSPYYNTVSLRHSFGRFLLEKPAGLAWLAWGAAPWEHAVTHWRSLLSVILPDERITHFRYYSPAVMADFLPSCTAQEIAALLGPLSGMAVPLTDGTWLFAEHPAQAPAAPDAQAQFWRPRQAPWWMITDRQLAALSQRLRATLIHNIRWDVWQNEPCLIEPFETFEALDQFIETGIEQAERWGFILPRQQEAFARLCLAVGIPNLESKPAYAAVLQSPHLSSDEKLAKLTLLSGET